MRSFLKNEILIVGKRMNRIKRRKRSLRTRRGGKRSVRTRRGGKKQRIIKGGAPLITLNASNY